MGNINKLGIERQKGQKQMMMMLMMMFFVLMIMIMIMKYVLFHYDV